MKRFLLPVLYVGATTLALVLGQASADAQDKARPTIRPIFSGKTPPATPSAPATPAPPADAGAAAADAGVKEKGKEGPEQKKRRKDYVDRITKEVRAIVRSDKILTAEEKELVRQHWRRSMRAHRIRLLAEDEKDNAVVARVDAYLAKIEKQLVDKLKELQKKQPAAAAVDGGKK